MIDERVPAIEFNQYLDTELGSDRLLLFAARAKVLAQWAGVPRKGWRMRMLYQRWVTSNRERELEQFWDRAAKPKRSVGEDYILGPTAITVAVREPLLVKNGNVHLHYESPIDFAADPVNNLARLAAIVEPQVRERLVGAKQALVAGFDKDPLQSLPEVHHDYVLEFALQLAQMRADARWFVDENAISDDDVQEMIVALEALCRPALVVDGQHRLLGAADVNVHVVLPVVAMPHAGWVEQIYQFIVINEKAQKVESALLTDIFGSSLTKEEQSGIRDRLARARVDVEARIAAVVANRDETSPFFNMVKLPLGGGGANPAAYITDTTIRLLIDGTARSARGWRSDEDFYEFFVKPTIPDSIEWESWTGGQWRAYWFTFWRTVGEFYNDQAAQTGAAPLWDPGRQTNLTKAVTLRILQKLFMDKMTAHMQQLDELRPMLEEALGPEGAESAVQRRRVEDAIPRDLNKFRDVVVTRFLEYIPIKIFLANWVSSLDDDEGRAELYGEFEKAYDRAKTNQTYRITNPRIFTAK